ncbi:hypothetical protein AB0C07_34735 [Actinoplanes missouriensis]|uniref:hypothetical protein n=1 Tax=Actinoplanes missouriensis TaxID=1866 RepID=UPI00340C0F6C
MTRRRARAILVTTAIAVAAWGGAAAPAAAAPHAAAASCSNPTNILFNSGAGAIGVMHLWDGVYGADGKQKYDAKVNSLGDTCSQFRWNEVRGYYVGPGACANVRFAPTGPYPYQWGTWRKVTAGSRPISANNHVQIEATRC